MHYLQRPEDRYNPVFDNDRNWEHKMQIIHRKPLYRAWNFINLNFILPKPIDELLDKHAHRTNSMKVVAMAFAGFYCGSLILYFRYKKIHEEKLVENYGQDLPYHVKFKYGQLFQYYRAYYIHFYRYKLFYFLDE